MTEFKDSLNNKVNKILSQRKVKGDREMAQQLAALAFLIEDLGFDFFFFFPQHPCGKSVCNNFTMPSSGL